MLGLSERPRWPAVVPDEILLVSADPEQRFGYQQAAAAAGLPCLQPFSRWGLSVSRRNLRVEVVLGE